MKSNVDCKDLRFYIYPTDMEDFSYTLTLVSFLEMCGLAINIATFSHLLKKVDFDAVVDHLAITHIMRSKAEPATTRIKRLIELLSPYSFNLYYIKGKDMVLSDFFPDKRLTIITAMKLFLYLSL